MNARRSVGRGSTLLLAVVGLSCGETVRWTPGSSDLLFMSNRDGNGEIYLLRAGSSTWVNLTQDPAGDNWPEWSPDGRRIAFQSKRSGNLDIWLMDADGSDPRQLTDDPAHDYLPSWSPDGKQITFASWRQESGDEDRANHIYVMNADGSGQRRMLRESPGTSAGVSWSPDGRLLVADRKLEGQGADVFVIEPGGEIVARLTTDDPASNGDSSFSPDGSHVAFYSDLGESSKLVVIGVDGTGRRELLTEGRNWYPRWSPDGRWLVYTAAVGDEAEDLDVRAVPIDGSSPPVTLAGGPGREAEGRWRPIERGQVFVSR